MTVGALRQRLLAFDQNAEVFISEPFGKDDQENHVAFGAAYLATDGSRVWFETYGDDDIGYELDAISEYVIDHALSDDEYVDIVCSKDEHGYTREDIRRNCPASAYEWLLNNEYRKEAYPEW